MNNYMKALHNIKSFFADAFRGTYFYWFPIFIAAGIFYYFSQSNPPVYELYGIFALILSYPAYKFLRSEHYGLSILCAAPMLFFFGVLLIGMRTEQLGTVMLKKETRLIKITGEVSQISSFENGHRVVLRGVGFEERYKGERPSKVRLRTYHGTGLQVGDKISVLAKLRPPSKPVYPGGFDFARYAYYRGWGAVGFTLSEFEILEHSQPRVSHFFQYLRQDINERLDKIENEKERGIAKALLAGEKQAVPSEVLQDIRDSGLAHLLSISGLHVGLFAGFIFVVVRTLLAAIPAIALRYPIKKIAAVIGLLSAVFYMLLVGAPVPTQRAVLMSGIVFIVILFDRTAISFRLAAFAALVIMLLKPESVIEASFQLSFAAVLSLIAFYSWATHHFAKLYYGRGLITKFILYVVGVIVTTVIASIATAPFTLYHFQHLSLLGNISNLVAVPLMSFVIMPAGIIALGLMPFGLEQWPLWAVSEGIRVIIDIAHWTASMEGAVYLMPQWPDFAMALITIGGLVILLCHKWFKLLGFVLIILSGLLTMRFDAPDLLISESASLVVFHADGQLYKNETRKDRYSLKQWTKIFGQRPADTKFYDGCDRLACRYEIKGHNISYVTARSAVEEECLWADILITRFVYKGCKKKDLIDFFDLRYKGSHGIWIKDHYDIRTVSQMRGTHAWVQ